MDVDMHDIGEEEDEGDENDLLQQALAMSMGGGLPIDMSELSEDEQLQLAMQLSLQQQQPEPQPTGEKAEPQKSSTEQKTETQAAAEPDPEEIQAILGNLPGVDPNDPAIKVCIPPFVFLVSIIGVINLLTIYCLQSLLESMKKKEDK